jgi:hypothetical protein
MYKTEKTSALSLSSCEVGVTIGLDGDFNRPDQLLDHMMTAAITGVGLEAVQNGISEHHQNGGTDQKCDTSVEIGQIKVYLKITITSARHISNKTINSMLFGVVLPKTLEAASIYLGDNRSQTTPPAPLTAQPQSELHDKIDRALSLPSAHSWQTTTNSREPELAGAGV